MAEESQALVRFTAGWALDGVSEDGLPRYRETVRVIKSVPPYTEIEREATQLDFDENHAPYQLFLKEQGARQMQPGERGFPLAMWPVINPAMFKMLADRDILTVEQLAAIAHRNDMPGEFKELADRAKQMLALSDNLGKYEAMLRDVTSQRDVLAEQVKELQSSLSAANALINTLKMKAA